MIFGFEFVHKCYNEFFVCIYVFCLIYFVIILRFLHNFNLPIFTKIFWFLQKIFRFFIKSSDFWRLIFWFLVIKGWQVCFNQIFQVAKSLEDSSQSIAQSRNKKARVSREKAWNCVRSQKRDDHPRHAMEAFLFFARSGASRRRYDRGEV